MTDFKLMPIGRVETREDGAAILIDPPYRKGLTHLEDFSHFMAIWWADQMDTPEHRQVLDTPLPYAGNINAGVFACRAEFRPNPIAVTICQCLDLDREKGRILVPYMDAFDRTPVLDIKPYFPVSDRVREVRTPDWVKDWPQWYEEAYKLAAMFAGSET